MNNTINTIVLKTQQYRDKDLLLHVISKEYGFLSLIFYNINNISSTRKVYTLEYGHYEYIIDYKFNKTIYSPIVKNIINYNEYILSVPKVMTVSGIIADLILKSNYLNFDFICETYKLLNSKNYIYVFTIFLVRILDFEGIMPAIDSCSKCNSTSVINFEIVNGGYVCSNCTSDTNRLSLDDLRNIRKLIKADYSNLEYFTNSDTDYTKLINVLVKFYEYYTNVELKGYQILKTLL